MKNKILDINFKEVRSESESGSNKVIVKFHSYEDRVKWIKENSVFAYSRTWWDQIGFANFSLIGEDKIIAISSFHSITGLEDMFTAGLKNY